jgi:hypothetical protein
MTLRKQAVGFKLSKGMEVPKELEVKYKFVRQKSTPYCGALILLKLKLMIQEC